MYGMPARAAHAFALIRREDIGPAALAALLADRLVAMSGGRRWLFVLGVAHRTPSRAS
ncbi:hypothetical protein AB0B94_21470 [Micromonospora sp. NPDC048986]|uniref:hypothetical protein n=1 Tax=Micromonospora sp. NPDC048986 TaxID=3155644 RepID=UPI0033C20EBF